MDSKTVDQELLKEPSLLRCTLKKSWHVSSKAILYASYVIVATLSFNVSKFRNDTEQGLNHLWLICLDDMPGIIRFKGVVTGHNVRVFIDIFSLAQQTKDLSHAMFVTTPHYQNLTAKQAADLVFWEVRGTKMYHDGKECTP